MSLPFDYDQRCRRRIRRHHARPPPISTNARVVILPVPLDRTTSYVPGTRNGPHEILVASSHMELWDEETETDVHSIGIFTLPEMEFPFATMDEVVGEIRRVAAELVARGKFPFVLGGEHSITRAGRRRGGGEISRPVGAADRRARRSARLVHGHAAQPRLRDAAGARVRADDAGRHPQPVARGSGGRAVAADRDLLRLQHAAGSELDRSRRRFAERDGLHHHRLRWIRSGDHAGDRHAGAGRADLVRGADAAAAGDRVAATSSAATSSSCRRCPATSRRTSCARS